MSTETVVTPAVRGWAEQRFPEIDVEITRRDIAKFAHATGETDAIYFDPEAARAVGYRDVVAPQMFYLLLRSEPYHLRPRAELKPDGSAGDDIPPVSLTRAMAGETSLDITGRFVAGDVVTCAKRVVDVTEKQGRSGFLLFLHFEYRYSVAAQAVVVERFTRILR